VTIRLPPDLAPRIMTSAPGSALAEVGIEHEIGVSNLGRTRITFGAARHPVIGCVVGYQIDGPTLMHRCQHRPVG